MAPRSGADTAIGGRWAQAGGEIFFRNDLILGQEMACRASQRPMRAKALLPACPLSSARAGPLNHPPCLSGALPFGVPCLSGALPLWHDRPKSTGEARLGSRIGWRYARLCDQRAMKDERFSGRSAIQTGRCLAQRESEAPQSPSEGAREQ
jgi:hypothetical protein